MVVVKALFYFLISSFLIACGGGSNPDLVAEDNISESKRLGGQKAEVLSGLDSLQFSNGELEGSGSVRFAERLSKAGSANHFSIDFELDAGSSLTLITNSLDDLSKGIELVFSRPLNANTLTATAKVGDDFLDLSDFFTSIDSSQKISLSLDIHNDHGANVHLLVWAGVNAIANANGELVDDILNGRGFGSNWGLILQQARVLNVAKGDPRNTH